VIWSVLPKRNRLDCTEIGNFWDFWGTSQFFGIFPKNPNFSEFPYNFPRREERTRLDREKE
jgi:hypothetical protein